MANSGVDAFLQAEEQAHRLMDELARLKNEAESYKTAHQALDQAAEGVSGLAARVSESASQLADVVETLRSIGTPELLRRQEALANEMASLRQDLDTKHQLIMEALARAYTAGRTVKHLVLGSIGLSLAALALLGWVILALAGGR